MYNKKPLLLIFILVIISIVSTSVAYAQNGSKITGSVVNAKKSPVPYATITLMNNDSSVVNGGITDDAGKFEIAAIKSGKYILRITGIGITDKIIADITVLSEKENVNLGEIKVTTSANVLDEVKIVSEKAYMEMGIDKKTFNVEKNTTATGGSASDVLQNVPSVAVDPDGSVSLRGKSGVTILIDGKPATLLGGDEASALQSLPASSIEQVEVITNPSAKYDATGMTGIINIITKKEKRFGFNGNVRAGAGTRDKYNAGLGLNLKNEKWNLFLNSNFRQNRIYRRVSTKVASQTSDAHTFSYEDNIRIFNGFFNTIGAEYNIDTNNSITLTQNLNKMRWGGNGVSNLYSYPTGSDLQSNQERSFVWGGGPFSTSSAIDYKRKLKEREGTLTANTTFVKSWQDRVQEYVTNVYNSNDELISGPIYQDAPGKGSNTSSNSQVDYSANHFTDNGKLEAGLKSQLFWLESSNTPVIDTGSGPMVDSILQNGYDYSQQIYAAYTSWGDKVGKFRYQAGLRMEYFLYSGTTTQLDQEYSKEFLNLFPSVFMSYELPKDQSVYLSYTRRTDRPRFWHLLPYVDLSNPQDTNVGNPDLVPEFIHNVELNYNKIYEQGHNIIVSGYYQYTQNLIERFVRYNEDGRTYTQRRNLASGVTYGLELTGQIQLVKRVWDVTLNTNLFQNEINGANIDPALDNSGFGWFAKVNSNIKLPANFAFQVNYNYRGPRVLAQGRREDAYWIDVALSKNFWDGKANLVLNVSDILNTQKFATNVAYRNSVQYNYTDKETRIGNITFSYRFGSTDKSPFGGKRRGRRAKSDDIKPETNKDRDNIKDGDDDGGGY